MADITPEALNELKKILGGIMAPAILQTDGTKELVALPEDLQLYDLDDHLLQPRQIERHLKVTDIATFCSYWDKWSDQHSEIFADIDKRTVRAVFDEHTDGVGEGEQRAANALIEPVARWGRHTVSYESPLSREWQAWADNDKSRMDQVEFAEFLEDRIAEVVQPAGADLQEIITNFRLQRDVTFDSAIRLQDGGVQLKYHEQNEPVTDMEMPEELELAVAPFHNGTVYKLRARLRYRLHGGSLALWYERIEPWRVLEHAFCAQQGEEDGPKSGVWQIAEHSGRFVNMVELGTV